MKISLTSKELLALAKLAKDANNVYSSTIGDYTPDDRSPKTMVQELLNSLSIKPEKHGPLEVRVNKKLEYVIELDPNFVKDIFEVGTKYTRTAVPVIAGLVAMSKTFGSDISEISKKYMDEEPAKETKHEETTKAAEPKQEQAEEKPSSKEPAPTTKESAESTTTDETASPKATEKEIIKPVYFENEEDK